MSLTASQLPTSPMSTSSYDILSACSSERLSSEPDSDSDDEIIWLPQASASEPSSESSILSDSDEDDFVVLSQPSSPSYLRVFPRTASERFNAVCNAFSTDDDLSSAFSGLSLRRNTGNNLMRDTSASIARPPLKATVTNALVAQPPLAGGISKSQKKKQKKAKKAKKAAKKVGKPTRAAVAPKFPVRDDGSSDTTEGSTTSAVSEYDEAVNFITSFLSSPGARDSVCKLTLLRSLILELGLRTSGSSSALPGSLTAAKALLKKQAHVNIREYIAVRQQGQAALQKVMHPSRSALIKSIRQKKNPASLKWVKSQGLQVLLVTCFR